MKIIDLDDLEGL